MQPSDNPTRYELCPLTLDDVLALRAACWPHGSAEAVREMLQRTLALMANRRVLGLVARVAAGAFAYGQLTMWPRTAEISDLIVAEAWRNRSVGTALIGYLIETARLWQAPRVEIGATLSNPRALALYRRLGFQDDRLLALDLGNGAEPVLYLSMPLTG